MQHPSKSRFSLSTKLALAIIVVVGIVAFLYYSPEEFNLGGLGSIGESVGGIFTFANSQSGERFDFAMQSSVNPLAQEVKLENASLSAKGLNLESIEVDDLVFDNFEQTSEIAFESFDGKVVFRNDSLAIEGTASSATIDGVKLKARDGDLKVSARIVPVSYSMSPVSLPLLLLKGTSGKVDTNGNSTVQFTSADIEVVGFEGSLSSTGSSHSIAGSALEVRSKNFSLKG